MRRYSGRNSVHQVALAAVTAIVRTVIATVAVFSSLSSSSSVVVAVVVVAAATTSADVALGFVAEDRSCGRFVET